MCAKPGAPKIRPRVNPVGTFLHSSALEAPLQSHHLPSRPRHVRGAPGTDFSHHTGSNPAHIARESCAHVARTSQDLTRNSKPVGKPVDLQADASRDAGAAHFRTPREGCGASSREKIARAAVPTTSRETVRIHQGQYVHYERGRGLRPGENELARGNPGVSRQMRRRANSSKQTPRRFQDAGRALTRTTEDNGGSSSVTIKSPSDSRTMKRAAAS